MKQSRLKTSWTFGLIISLLTAYSIYKDMNEVALIGVAALAGIVSKYSHDETKRSSKKRNLLDSEG